MDNRYGCQATKKDQIYINTMGEVNVLLNFKPLYRLFRLKTSSIQYPVSGNVFNEPHIEET